MVKPFDQYEGIDKVTSGYMGGTTENPTYEEVKRVIPDIMKLSKSNMM